MDSGLPNGSFCPYYVFVQHVVLVVLKQISALHQLHRHISAMDAMYFAMSGPELDDDAPPANAPPDADADDSADADAEAEPNAQDAGIEGEGEGGKGARVRKFLPSITYFYLPYF